MPTPPKGARLGGGPAHERLILANLATQLFEHQSISTTLTKAKRLRPYAERLITFAKRGDLASRRRVMRVIRDKDVVHELFTEIAPTMAERQGGYTRIIKIGPRKGDGAPMAVIQLVMEPVKPSKKRAVQKDAASGVEAPKAEAKAKDALAKPAEVGDQADAAEALTEKAEAAALAGAVAEAEADEAAMADLAAADAAAEAKAEEKAEDKAKADDKADAETDDTAEAKTEAKTDDTADDEAEAEAEDKAEAKAEKSDGEDKSAD